MSKYQHQVLHAPLGVDLGTDSPSIPEFRAAHIEGFFPARQGVLRPSYPLRTVVPLAQVDWAYPSIFLYRSPLPLTSADIAMGRTTRDLLVGVHGGTGEVRYVELRYVPTQQAVEGDYPWGVPAVASAIPLGAVTPPSGPAPFIGVQVGPELFLCNSRGSSIYSFYVSSTGLPTLVQLGLDPPPAPVPVPTTGGSLTASSYYEYYFTIEDAFGRESSPSNPAPVATTTSVNAFRVTFPIFSQQDRLWERIHLYRTLAGGGRGYRVATATFSQVWAGYTFIDTQADSVVAESQLMPYPHQNDPPQPAVNLLHHKSRLWAVMAGSYLPNSTFLWGRETDKLSILQVSNLLSYSQFSRAEEYFVDITTRDLSVTDGTHLAIDSTAGDQITGLASAGAVLCVWKNSGMWLVWGDDVTTFSVQAAHTVGCSAPRSVCSFRGQLVWRGPDGVYITNGAGGFIPRKISQAIDPVFRQQYPWLRTVRMPWEAP